MLSNFFAKGHAKLKIFSCLVLVGMLFLSFHLRQQDFNGATGAPNLEAPYHVLLTVIALQESGINNHWLLPTVSLGKESDKSIPWGITTPTVTGDQIYASFTSAGFLAPYVWFKLFDQEPTITNLARFNFFLGALATFALFFFLIGLLRFNGYSTGTALLSALGAVSISIFSREALLSHGIIYWSQSLYQVLLITTTWCLFKFLSKPEHERTSLLILLTSALAFAGAMTEWTGFVYNLGLAAVLFSCQKSSPKARNLAIYVLAATFLAGLLIVLHYGLATGFERAYLALSGGFFSRSASVGGLKDLMQSYALSYGLFLVVIFGLLVTRMVTPSTASESRAQQNVLLLVFVASCVPLLENILMLQHATQFSFDRLKFILPASIAVALSLAQIKDIPRTVFLILLTGSCIYGYTSYKSDLRGYAAWQNIDADNKKLRDMVLAQPNAGCAVFSSNIAVRGYANLLFHRGMYEHKSIRDSLDLIKLRNACASVFVEGIGTFIDLPQYISATITDSSGASINLMNPSASSLKAGVNTFYLTDGNWEHGISRLFTGFFVPNISNYSNMYVPGSVVKFRNGESRTVIRADSAGQYLHVFVSGDLLEASEVGVPSEFIVLDKPSASKKTGVK